MPTAPRRLPRRSAAAALVAVLLLGAGPALRAHVAIPDQIGRLTVEIRRHPGDARLLLKRGELHRVHRMWRHAEEDYRRALSIDPGLETARLCHGRLLVESGRPAAALAPLDRYVSRHPGRIEGRVWRGRALRALGRPLDAAAELGVAVSLASERGALGPEHPLEQAEALAEAGGVHLDGALAVIEAGIRSLGPLVTLQLAAADLERRLGRPDDALARLERLATAAERPESFLIRQAEILEGAGRVCEARRRYERTLQAIAALPQARRWSANVTHLERGAGDALRRLDVCGGAGDAP